MIRLEEGTKAELQNDPASFNAQRSKRLLAALKVKYEKQLVDLKEEHEAEQKALKDQLAQLKFLLKVKPVETRQTETIENELNLSKQRNDQFERVIQHLRERMEEAKLETNNLRIELESEYNKKENCNEPFCDNPKSLQEKVLLQDHYEQLRIENIQLTSKLEEALEARISAENTLQKVKQQEQDKEQALLEESESRLRIAQQHLAKKVKEVTLLNEREDEMRREHEELTQSLEVFKGRVSELQGSLGSMRDGLKSAEAQVAKWEEKYFDLYDKWQESEMKYRELKKIEDKFFQMQSLLANLGSFMGPTPHFLNTLAPLPVDQDDKEPQSPYDFFGYQQEKNF